MDNQLFVRNIRNICKAKGKSISQVEADLGWSPGLISRWSKTCPSFEKVAAIVSYLGISFENLLESDITPIEQPLTTRLIQKLTQLSEDGTILWKPCDGDANITELLLPLADDGCLISQAYYFMYQEGYFFLIMAEDDLLPFSPRLYIAPDRDTLPVLESDDRKGLGRLLACADKELYASWSQSKKHQLIKRFLEDAR